MTIEKRVRVRGGVESTTYRVRYYDQNGKRREKEFIDEASAKKFDRNPLGMIAKGTVKVRTPKRPILKKDDPVYFPKNVTVEEAFDLYLRLFEKGNDGEPPPEAFTIYQYRSYYKNHVKIHLGISRAADVTLSTAEQYRDKLAAEPIARRTARKIFDLVRRVFDALAKDRVISANPFASLKIKISKRDKTERRAPEPSELHKVLDWMIWQREHGDARMRMTYRRYYIVIRLFAFGGLRMSELRGLRWPRVKLDEQMIQVRERADAMERKLGAPKSAAGTRDIFISEDLVKDLREWKLACPPSELDLVIPTFSGGLENPRNLLSRAWQVPQIKLGMTKLNKKGKVVAKYTIHELRHFFASLRVDGGYSMKDLQEEIGHASIVTTMDIYGHLFKDGAERRKQKVQEIERNYFGGKAKTGGGNQAK